MSFEMPIDRSVRWRPLGGEGLEHLTIRSSAGGISVRSVVIGARGGPAFGVFYRIECDDGWRVRSFDLETTAGQAVRLQSDGAGHWQDGAGTDLPALRGCIDVDLAGTPFTNTLPIRRLDLAPGATATLGMVYIPFDTFEPTVDGQRYTCLIPGALYRYEAADLSFQADLPVDADGLVMDYPTLFERL